MAFFLIGVALLIAYLDWLGTQNLLAAGRLLKAEFFTNQDPFFKWFGALLIVGMIGYIPNMRPVSIALLTLIILSVVLSHESGFAKLTKAQ